MRGRNEEGSAGKKVKLTTCPTGSKVGIRVKAVCLQGSNLAGAVPASITIDADVICLT